MTVNKDQIQQYEEQMKAELTNRLNAIRQAPESNERGEAAVSLVREIITDMMVKHSGAADRFWAYLMSYVSKAYDPRLQQAMGLTIVDNRFVLNINPAHFGQDWTIDNLRSVILHNGYHILMDHMTMATELRQSNVPDDIIDFATDVEVNQYLKDLPSDAVTLDMLSAVVGQQAPAKAGTLAYVELLLQNQDSQGNGGGSGSSGCPACGQDNSNGGGGEGDQNQDQEPNDGNGDGNGDQQKDQKQNNGGGNKPKQCNHKMDSHNGWNSPSDISPRDLARSFVDQARQDTKLAGDQAGELLELVNKLMAPPVIPWQRLFKRAIGRQVHSKRQTINRLNRRQPFNLIKKGRINDYVQPIVVAFDVSGSVSSEELAGFYNEIHNLAKKHKLPLEVLQFDTEIHKHFKVSNVKDIDYTAEGRGGTCFQSVFDWLKDNKYDRETMVFVFSDGYGESRVDYHGFNKHYWVLTKTGELSVSTNREIIRLNN